MCKLCCISCCQVPPKRNTDDDKVCIGPCCFSCSCLTAKNTCWGIDMGCSHYQAMQRNPVNMEKFGAPKHRPIFSTAEQEKLGVVGMIPTPPKTPGCKFMSFFCCIPCCRWDCSKFCCGKCLAAEQARQESSYTWLFENRLEINYPYVVPDEPKSCLACIAVTLLPPCSYCILDLGVRDNSSVYYYDHPMFDTIKKPGCCAVKIQNCQNWCCGFQGEPIYLKDRYCASVCPGIPARICGRTQLKLYVPKGEAQKYKEMILKAKSLAREKAGLKNDARSGNAVGVLEVMQR